LKLFVQIGSCLEKRRDSPDKTLLSTNRKRLNDFGKSCLSKKFGHQKGRNWGLMYRVGLSKGRITFQARIIKPHKEETS